MILLRARSLFGTRWRRDEGQLMLLSGIIVTISFILTSLTLAQVSSLERAATTEHPVNFAEEWRFIHDRLGANLEVAVSPETTNSTLLTTTFPTITATFRNIEAEKGFDTVIRLASADLLVNKTETDLLNAAATSYSAWDAAGTEQFTQAYDGSNDGILWMSSCTGGTPTGCIGGLLVFVRLSDGINTMEEVLLVPVNADSW